MKRTERLGLALLWLLMAACASGQTDEAAPAQVPLDDVRALVGQLGSDQFHLREQAQAKLLDLGEGLLPLLEQLDPPTDNEVKWRLHFVRRHLEQLRRRREAGPMVGTRWHVTFSDEVKATHSLREKTLTFNDDFTFSYAGPNDNRDETWEPVDADGVFRFHYNEKYATYEGRFVDGDTMQGTAHNKNGRSWTWTAKRVGEADPPPNDK
jgi:hypothetical protein